MDTYLTVNELNPAVLNRTFDEQHYPGGKGIHVAIAATELGEQAVVLGCWGGPTGKWLKEKCVELNVACSGPEVNGWNRINTTLRSEGVWNDTELVAQGPHITENQYHILCKEFEALLPESGAVVMSGSWPQGAPADAYGPLIELTKKYRIPVWIDCSGDLLLKALLHRPFGIHINQSELNAVLPKHFENKPADYFLHFVQQVALTAGAAGLQLATNKESLRASCSLEKIFSAVGSGDCLTAGLAVAHLRDYDLKSTARFAAACGSANCIREELGLLYRKDVEALLEKVVVSPM
ncbi:MAG: hypothetical protein IPO83_12120 [Chitinophagaceae bacterium]|nr:hypothetical protein [Chitinophagaceae bacterium]